MGSPDSFSKDGPAQGQHHPGYPTHAQAAIIDEEFDAPPSYELSQAQPGSTNPSPSSAAGVLAHPSLSLASDRIPSPSKQPEAPSPTSSVADEDVPLHGAGATHQARPYESQKPMAVFKMSEMKREKLLASPGFCFSSSGGFCFSSMGGCCFSKNQGCCFSNNSGCCFSNNGGCCFSNNGGCCFSNHGGCCF